MQEIINITRFTHLFTGANTNRMRKGTHASASWLATTTTDGPALNAAPLLLLLPRAKVNKTRTVAVFKTGKIGSVSQPNRVVNREDQFVGSVSVQKPVGLGNGPDSH